jgi:rubrerythrin
MEKSVKGTRTEQNLLKAFAGESQAKNRYEFAAKVAKEEGYEQISGIFIETALQEQQHAKRFFRFLEGGMVEITASYPGGKIDTTRANLFAAAEGEHEEWSDLYPAFAKTAEEEGFTAVSMQDKVFERDEKVFWYCRKCGYIHFGTKPLKNCPACLHPEAYFEILANNY